MSVSEDAQSVLVDCHVHYHTIFDVDTFFDAALANFQAAAVGQGTLQRVEYVLMLTEAAGRDYFAAFGAAARTMNAKRWRFTPTAEPTSLLAQRADGARLTLVAGRQIAASGGLEVLALGTDHHYRDGGGFFDTISQVLDDGALAVVPWGFGKWWFRRGHRVAEAIRAFQGRAFFLGDNGGRLRYGSPPVLFDHARAVGIWTLPGTDPLPLRNHQTRAGSYGCVLKAPLILSQPAASLVDTLASALDQPTTYGELQSLARFSVAQVAMQFRKHLTHG